MKKFAAFLSAALILAGCAGVYAAAGTEADPLISLSWLNSHYIPEAVRQAEAQIDARTLTVYQSVLSGLTSAGAPDTPAADPAGLSDRRLKRGDVLTLPAGSTVMLLAGSASISYSSGGTVVDLTAGQALPAGAAAAAFHRLLAAENTTAAVTVTSDTAVLSTEGAYTLSPAEMWIITPWRMPWQSWDFFGTPAPPTAPGMSWRAPLPAWWDWLCSCG